MTAVAARAANIVASGRRRRLLLGAGALAVGGIALAVLVLTGVDPGWRLLLVAPFWFGALGVFQARGRT
jgi:hypothetical protein